MKTATVKELKEELSHLSQSELEELCLRLSRFKKENKELLTYLLYEASNESGYIEDIKTEISQQFTQINTDSYYYIKKSVRKILRRLKTYIRYSKIKETEIELLLYFCSELKNMQPSIMYNVTLTNLYNRQISLIKKTITSLHEDLQYDYNLMLEEL
jgi:vacuolar-type H+-ATPase catalytic subunit A/Vma1